MCVACFTTAQLATVGAVSARWWWVNKWRGADDDDLGDSDGTDDLDPAVADGADEADEEPEQEPVPVA